MYNKPFTQFQQFRLTSLDHKFETGNVKLQWTPAQLYFMQTVSLTRSKASPS